MRNWLRIGLSLAAVLLLLVGVEFWSISFVMYRVRTEIDVRVLSRGGAPLVGAQVVPLWAGEPVEHIAAEATDAAGVARFRLDLRSCRSERPLSSLFLPRHPHSAFVPYEFRVEHPGFETRVLSPREPLASWLAARELPDDLDAKLVLQEVELQPLGLR